MTNSEQAIREIAEKHFPCVGTRNDREYRKMEQDALVSSITALISEHYVSREKYDELLQQRDELKEVKGFRIEPYQHTRKAPKLKCDCGCKADLRYVCGNCGDTFCGTKHGAQDRDGNGTALDLCDKCVPIILGIEKK